AVDVQDEACGRVEDVVPRGRYVPDPAYVGGERLPFPPVPAEDERSLRQSFRDLEEEPFDPRLTIRQPVAHEEQVARRRRIVRDRVVDIRVEAVVDRVTGPCAERPVSLYDRRSAAV